MPSSSVSTAPSRTVRALTAFAGLTMLVPGVWAWLAPESFATAVNWPHHAHFAHDAGVFQIAIGTMLFVALGWRDALAVTLVGFVCGSGLHAFNHLRDLPLGGGSPLDPIGLAVFTAVGVVGFALRVRELKKRKPDGGDDR